MAEQTRRAEARIIIFHLGYGTEVDKAELALAQLLDAGWAIQAGGGSQNAGFVVLARWAEAQATAPSTRGPATNGRLRNGRPATVRGYRRVVLGGVRRPGDAQGLDRAATDPSPTGKDQ